MIGVGSLAVHAEELRLGSEVLRGDSLDVVVRYVTVFASLMASLADVVVDPPLPNPRWVRWDHTDAGVWPVMEEIDLLDRSAVPQFAVDTAVRIRARVSAADLPRVLGHADFEAQNLRWQGGKV